jgi:hypothetical protein
MEVESVEEGPEGVGTGEGREGGGGREALDVLEGKVEAEGEGLLVTGVGALSDKPVAPAVELDPEGAGDTKNP